MTNNGCWVLLCMMVAFAPLGAEVNESQTAISEAFNTGNSTEALTLVGEAFAKLKPEQTAEAAVLVQSILAVTPMDHAGQVVVAAIKGNPALGDVILSAISGTSQVEQLTILSRVSYDMSRDPDSFVSVSGAVPKLLNAVDETVPVSQKLTASDYNPTNVLSEVGVAISPNRPDIRRDRRDIRHDETELLIDLEKLLLDRSEHKPQRVIEKAEDKVKAVEKDIRADEKDLRRDLDGH